MPRLLDLINLDLIDLHSLQFGDDAGQLDPWISHERITHWPERLSDFSDTAHVIRQLDLVISVDTAVAHLAGALNRPTWLLLPQNADFRWLKDRSDCPWYPSMRLFRQASHGDWAGVVDQVKAAFDDVIKAKEDEERKQRLGLSGDKGDAARAELAQSLLAPVNEDKEDEAEDDPALRGDGIIEQNIRRRKERERQKKRARGAHLLARQPIKYGKGRLQSTHNLKGAIESPWSTTSGRFKPRSGDRTF